jgi:DNA invertase Pin-like site-specific DNA recombinase
MQYIAYFRVSTKKQGKSGNGLDAQKRDIQLYLDNYAPKDHEIIHTCQDIQSGKNDERPELVNAIAMAKQHKATLLVSKLDRLSRRVSFIAKIMEDKQLSLTVASMPHADKFQLHIYAALAEQERDFISIRTKAGLKSIKERNAALIAKGVSTDELDHDGKTLIRKIGGHHPESLTEMNKVRRQNADQFAQRIEVVITPLIGHPLQHIADALNDAGVKTTRGLSFKPTTVKRIIDRIERNI